MIAFGAVQLAYAMAGLPGTVLFCDRSGETNCGLRFLLGQWRFAAGLLAGVPIAAVLRPGPPAPHALLRSVGTLVLAEQLLSVPIAVVISYGFSVYGSSAPRPAIDTDPLTIYFFVATLFAAACAGAVLAMNSGRRRMFVVLLGIVLLAALPQAVTSLTIPATSSLQTVSGLGTPVVEVLIVALAYAIAMRRSRGRAQR